MSEALRTVQLRIVGRVQGVGFRAWTAGQAEALGLRGWVRNRRDGAVEALFSGPDAAVVTMLERCRQGPRHARVDGIEIIEEGASAPEDFQICADAG